MRITRIPTKSLWLSLSLHLNKTIHSFSPCYIRWEYLSFLKSDPFPPLSYDFLNVIPPSPYTIYHSTQHSPPPIPLIQIDIPSPTSSSPTTSSSPFQSPLNSPMANSPLTSPPSLPLYQNHLYQPLPPSLLIFLCKLFSKGGIIKPKHLSLFILNKYLIFLPIIKSLYVIKIGMMSY